MSAQIGGLSPTEAMDGLAPWSTPARAIDAAEYARRIEQARALMRDQGVDALLVTAGSSLRYFAGVSWGASERLVTLLLTDTGEPVMICPAFETGSLSAVLRIDADVRTWEEHDDPHALVASVLKDRGSRQLALDPNAPFAAYARLRSCIGERAGIVDATSIIDGCRRCKSPAELALMSQATAMTLKVHRRAAGLVHEGITTLDLVRFIDTAHRALGADNGSSFCIVQFGHATAFPHGIPGVQSLRDGELVLIDTGCTVQGYNSDITRTYIYGKPDDDQQRIWDLERAAQQAAFAAVRPGVPCEAIDRAARAVLEDAGLGPDYRLPGLPHRTGHGCGIAIHEAPYLVRGDRTPLAPGMCFSDEPMIVVPGRFGVRLEDHFHVTDDGAAWFTEPSPAIDQPFAE